MRGIIPAGQRPGWFLRAGHRRSAPNCAAGEAFCTSAPAQSLITTTSFRSIGTYWLFVHWDCPLTSGLGNSCSRCPSFMNASTAPPEPPFFYCHFKELMRILTVPESRLTSSTNQQPFWLQGQLPNSSVQWEMAHGFSNAFLLTSYADTVRKQKSTARL